MKIEINSTGTRRGLSHWTQYLDGPCMRRLTANAGFSANEGSRRGILFHKLAELYHTDKLTAETISDGIDFVGPDGLPSPVATPTAVFQALRLAEFWFRHMPRRGLGTVLAAEASFPSTDEGRGAIQMALGDQELTGAADLVTEIRSQSQAAELDAAFTAMGSPLGQTLDPGVWLWDFKTVTDTGNAGRYEYGWQEIAYPWLWSLDNKGIVPKGMIYVIIAIGRRKVPTPAVETIIHPFPSDEKIGALIRFLGQAKRAKAALEVDTDSVNRARCAPKFRDDSHCPLLLDGRCSGY